MEAKDELLGEKIESLEVQLEREREARRSVERDAGQAQKTLDDAIDYRQAQRAVARESLMKIEAKEKAGGEPK